MFEISGVPAEARKPPQEQDLFTSSRLSDYSLVKELLTSRKLASQAVLCLAVASGEGES
jgi:hypothetical protein